MRETIEKTIQKLWSGPDTTPEIIVSLEDQGIKVTEKRVLDTAFELEMKGSDVQKKLFRDPSLMDKWWKAFEKREEKNALEMINADNVKNFKGVGRSRHIAGCYMADEMTEKGHKPPKVESALKKKGFEKHEIEKIKREVGF